MRRRDGLLACLLAALALAAPLPATAQEVAAPVAPARQGPEIVPQSEIPVRADADERYAQDVMQRSKARDPIERLGPPLEALGKSVAATAELFKGENLQLLSVIRLESLSRHWNFHAKQLEEWRRDLKQVGCPVHRGCCRAGQASRHLGGDACRGCRGRRHGPGPRQPRPERCWPSSHSPSRRCRDPIDQQIRLSRRANAIEDSIRAGQKAVSAAIAYNDLRLTRIDSPPYWKSGRTAASPRAPCSPSGSASRSSSASSRNTTPRPRPRTA